jgi:hypothetical protein
MMINVVMGKRRDRTNARPHRAVLAAADEVIEWVLAACFTQLPSMHF